MRFLRRVTTHLRSALAHEPYDSVTNFVMFAQEYQASEHTRLQEFYRDYDPPLVPGHYTCVGLVADLASRLSDLERHYPGIKDATYQVSCEEEVTQEDIDYCLTSDTPDVSIALKEHVLLCIRVRISGRPGVLLLDPGYHVGQPVTVMEDGLAPQSGPVACPTARSDLTRTFKYSFLPDNPAFVTWENVEKKGECVRRVLKALIHVSRPFLSAVDVSERRNLAYMFKTLLARDLMGRFVAGLYFPIKVPSSPSSTSASSSTITVFHKNHDGKMKHVRKPLSYFLSHDESEDKENKGQMEEHKTSYRSNVPPQQIGNSNEKSKTTIPHEEVDEEMEEAVNALEMGVGCVRGEIRSTLVSVAHLLQDHALVASLKEVNDAFQFCEKT